MYMNNLSLWCGSLNRNGPFRLLHLNANLSGIVLLENVRRSGCAVGVTLLEEVRHCRWALRFQKPKPVPVSLFFPCCLWIQMQDSQAVSVACVPLCHHVHHHDDNDVNLEKRELVHHRDDNDVNLEKRGLVPMKCFPLEEVLWSWCLHSDRALID